MGLQGRGSAHVDDEGDYGLVGFTSEGVNDFPLAALVAHIEHELEPDLVQEAFYGVEVVGVRKRERPIEQRELLQTDVVLDVRKVSLFSGLYLLPEELCVGAASAVRQRVGVFRFTKSPIAVLEWKQGGLSCRDEDRLAEAGPVVGLGQILLRQHVRAHLSQRAVHEGEAGGFL